MSDMNTTDKRKKLKKTILKDIAICAIAYAVFIIISSVANYSLALGSTAVIKSLKLPFRYAYILSSLLLPLTYYSSMRVFEMYDRESQRAYPLVDGGTYKLGSGIKEIFKNKVLRRKYITQISVSVLLAALLPYDLGYRFVVGSFFPTFEVDYLTAKLVSMAVVAPGIILFTLLAKTSAHKWWVVARDSIRRDILENRNTHLKILWGCIKVFLVYSISYLVIVSALLMITTVALVVGLFTLWFWVGGILLWLLFIAIKWALAFRRRRKFIRRLKKALPQAGYTLSNIKRPVLSVLIPRTGADFTIEKNGKKRDCKIVGTTRRRGPLYISPDGFVTEKRTIGFWWIKICHIMTDTAYAFEGENKIVIISPMQYKMYFNFGRKDIVPDNGDGGGLPTHYAIRRGMGGLYTDNGKTRSIHGPGYKSDLDLGIIKTFETGDKIGEYKFYSPSGFISAAENDVLDR